MDLASVGRVEVDYEKGLARLYPVSTASDPDSVEAEPYLGMVLSQLPTDAVGDNDLRLVAEVPLVREETDGDQVSLVDIADICIGKAAEEVWFLVRPADEFADGLLPT